MSRPLSKISKEILKTLFEQEEKKVELFYQQFKNKAQNKTVYNTIYRLVHQGLLEPVTKDKEVAVKLTSAGKTSVRTIFPRKDGVWKLIIYDIPEKKRYVRNVLRARLTSLGFKKWQSSIWVSPYELDPTIENELLELGKKFFIRLIRTTDINNTSDLDKLFTE